ncbi:MAG: hypothetical protein JXA30_21255 [Deltaproteobacteria bacterium]|nr:hypothetical protein [Deltaproteobacteria bacterium]
MSGYLRFHDYLVVVVVSIVLVGCAEDEEKKEGGRDSGTEDSSNVIDSGLSKDSGSFEDNNITEDDASDSRVETTDTGDHGETTDSGKKTCSLLLGVECDGDEDCPNGEVCCGTYRSTQATPGYTSIDCQPTCGFDYNFVSDADDDAGMQDLPDVEEMPDMMFKLCHKGEDCSVEGSDAGTGEACWSSSVLPPFLAVCLSSSMTFGEPASDMTANAVAGEINCGDETCTVGNEKCCLTDFTGDAYCTEIDKECDCDHAP